MNLVEVFFSIITREALRRGSFTSVDELTAVIKKTNFNYAILGKLVPPITSGGSLI